MSELHRASGQKQAGRAAPLLGDTWSLSGEGPEEPG